MGNFALLLSKTKADEEADLLLYRIQQGSDEEGNQALSELVDRAKRSGDPADWNAAGLGFHHAGLHDKATLIFDALVQNYPQEDIYRLNLATSYAQTEQIDLCRHHLRQIAEHGSTEELRRIGREQLEGYERFLGLTEEDQRLRELQVKSLQRAIASSERTPDDFITLARLFMLRGRLEPGGDWLAEATTVLERGKEAFPQGKEILELLVGSYLRHDPEGRLPESLDQLEKLDPNSEILELLARQDEAEAVAFSENIYQRANGLMEQALETNDKKVREAAVQDLGKIVAMYPENSGYRLIYAFTLMNVGKREAALNEAKLLANTPDDTHGFHFNLGQIFWICGDPAQGRYHLDLAMKYAADDQERQDVNDRIADLERPKP